MLTTLLAAAGGAIGGSALCAAVVLNVPRRHQRRLEEALMTQVLPELVTRQELSSAFARMAEVEMQREQHLAHLAAQQAQMARPFPMAQRPPVAEGVPASPLFQGEVGPGAAGQPNTQQALDQMQQQLNQQLAQLNQRLQTVATQRMPR
jgi:uncharacterized protein YceH (UPF0502 family)